VWPLTRGCSAKPGLAAGAGVSGVLRRLGDVPGVKWRYGPAPGKDARSEHDGAFVLELAAEMVRPADPGAPAGCRVQVVER
jgi:hypothetical protein